MKSAVLAVAGLLVILMHSPLALAQLETSDLYERSSLTLDTTIGSSLQLKPTNQDYIIDYVLIKLYFEPVADERLEVISFKPTPDAQHRNGALEFSFDQPGKLTMHYGVEAEIKTKAVYNLVASKVPYPIKEIPPAYEQYRELTESVDFNDPAIRALANELAEGEDDLYVVANKAAIWVRDHINYNLTTATVQASKPASWVLQNRKGVCDELTNLFLALMRALGVPARFVSGIAYTNSPLFTEKWGAHGWAEIYFPNIGWVPFDPTYGQFGWLDPAHITLKKSLDATEPSTKFEWRGRNVDLDAEPLDFTVNILGQGERVKYGIEITNKALKPSVGFGSYNVIETTVENKNTYYLTTDISLARTEGLEVIGQPQQSVILKPKSTAKLYWTVRILPGLNEGYLYTFPIMAYDLRNASGVSAFAAAKGEAVFSSDDAERFIVANTPSDGRTYTSLFSLACDTDPEHLLGEQALIHCIIANKGTRVLNNVRVCKQTRCSTITLNLGETQKAQFISDRTTPGKQVEIITATYGDEEVSDEVAYTLLDPPKAEIRDLNVPLRVRFTENFDMKFLVKQTSFAPVGTGTTSVLINGLTVHTWALRDLKQPVSYTFSMKGSDLKPGANSVSVVVSYPTKDGKREEKEDIIIELADVTLPQRVIGWFNRMGRWIASWF